ncbi:MAG: hypothetical protein KF893_26745 [Caldilineaceae bacterium]|nr:hypothetical protein [Caldilineaceae bacterium]
MFHRRLFHARLLIVPILLVLALSITSILFASPSEDEPTNTDAGQQTYFIYLPSISNQSGTATASSATLVQPPAVQQLGGLAGVLAAGFAIGVALLFWREPEEEGTEEMGRLGD